MLEKPICDRRCRDEMELIAEENGVEVWRCPKCGSTVRRGTLTIRITPEVRQTGAVHWVTEKIPLLESTDEGPHIDLNDIRKGAYIKPDLVENQ